jgi:FkbM family methyltransferase
MVMTASIPAAASSLNGSSLPLTADITLKLTPFDQKEYRKLIEARGKTIERVVKKLKPALGLSTAIDAGCGVGFFSNSLEECGLNVCGFDGRAENVGEARRRFPEIPFEQADIEDEKTVSLGKFDLVLCFGLLYHLENPVVAIRHLHALTEKCLLLESMCIPDEKPAMLLREEPRQDDQSLTDMACYPSEGSLVKMLYRSGFRAVYRVMPLPDHDDFEETREHSRRRTVLLASTKPIDVAGFRLCLEPHEEADPWAKGAPRRLSLAKRIWRFLRSSNRTKYITVAQRARRIFPNMPILLRLPFGAWWLAEKSALDHELVHNEFEVAEMKFVEKVLRPGMTVVDAGAHHGLYSLLASKRVGESGRVLAFEPASRECERMITNLRVNRSSNVCLMECALGNRAGTADLFLGDGSQDWCNSLRPVGATDAEHSVRVPLRRLDDMLAELGIKEVDFLKMDVEGAELSLLQGAPNLLGCAPRPAILAEVQDVRTLPWGYLSRDIVNFLAMLNYKWFAIAPGGRLEPISCGQDSYDANLVALPAERTEEFLALLAEGHTSAERGK